jgi:hypothetical protein
MDIMVMGRRAAAVMQRDSRLGGAKKEPTVESPAVARAVKLPSLAATRRTVQIEPSGRQLYILNNIM